MKVYYSNLLQVSLELDYQSPLWSTIYTWICIHGDPQNKTSAYVHVHTTLFRCHIYTHTHYLDVIFIRIHTCTKHLDLAFIHTHIYLYMYYTRLIGLVGRVFVNGLGDMGSIPGHVIPKTLKIVLDTSLLNTQQYKVRMKSKVEQSWERSSALPYSSYWKGSLLVTLDYSHQLYLLTLLRSHIYIDICVCVYVCMYVYIIYIYIYIYI